MRGRALPAALMIYTTVTSYPLSPSMSIPTSFFSACDEFFGFSDCSEFCFTTIVNVS